MSWLEPLRYPLRVQARQPWIAATIVVILAIGIGTVVAIFNLVNAMLIRPLPYREADALVALHARHLRDGTDWHPVSPANLDDWVRESRTLEQVATFARSGFNVSGNDDLAERLSGARVSYGLFPMLGVEPQVGRTFNADDDRPGAAPVVLIADDLWQRRFQSDRDVVGRTLLVDGVAHTVAGVMPPGFEFPEWAELWVPLAIDPAQQQRDRRWLDAYARLANGVTAEQAQEELSGLARRLEADHPQSNEGWGVRVRPLRDELMPTEARMGTLLLLAAVGFVLLIVCANVATLFLAQTVRRRREYAVRLALGARPRRILGQVLTESVLLALAGGALGVVVSVVAVRAIEAAVPVPIPFWIRFDLDYRVLLFTLAVATGAGVLFGLAPAARSAASRRFDVLRDQSRGSSGGRGLRRLRNGLVVAEFAIALVLLASSMLVVKSFFKMQQVDRGFATEGVLTASVSLHDEDHAGTQQRVAFARDVARLLREVPRVAAVGVVDYLPTSRRGFASVRVRADGTTLPPGEEPTATRHAIGDGYLDAVGLSLQSGRRFRTREIEEGAAVALVSRSLADRLWPDGEAVGRRLRSADAGDDGWLTVVGVVGNVRQAYSMTGLDAWPADQLYEPLGRQPAPTLSLVVRGRTGHGAELTDDLRQAVQRVDPQVPLFDLYTMEQVLARFEWLPRFWGQMFSALSIIALFIAALGVYGVTSYMVSQRRRELGIRMALGARPRQVLNLVVRQGMQLALFGVVAGLVLAFYVTRAMSALLYGVSATDATVFSGVALLLAATAFLASLVPGRRAARISPQSALRHD